MTEWYGARFAEQYGAEPPDDWCSVVDRSDDEVIKRALSIVRSRYTTHPPTFPEFEQAFKPSTDSKTPSTPDLLCAFTVKRYGARLTPKQLRGPWTYIGRSSTTGIEITGVVIAADGDFPSYRVNVEDMHAPEFEVTTRIDDLRTPER